MLRIFLPLIYGLAYFCIGLRRVAPALEWVFTWIGLLGLRAVGVFEQGRVISIMLLSDAASLCRGKRPVFFRDPDVRKTLGLKPLGGQS